MKKIYKAEDLKSAILELEARKLVEEEALNKQFHDTLQTFKPSSILKNTVSEVAAAPQFKHNILNLVLGLGAGYISKKVAVGKNAGLLARSLGTALQFGITSLVAKNQANENEVGHKKGNLLQRLFQKSRS